MVAFAACAAIALADNLRDDVVASGNGTITAGGSTTINYYIQATGGSCDAADGSAAAVTINVPSGVTVDTNPSVSGNQNTLTFTACDTSTGGASPTNTKAAVFSSPAAGSYAITASVTDATGSYNETPANFTLTVNPPAKLNQTITVGTPAPSSATYNTQFTVAATASSTLPIAYGSSGVCSNNGARYTMTSGTGTCTVTFDQGGNSTYNPAPQVTETVTATRANQTITFSGAPFSAAYNTGFQAHPTVDSGLAVSLAGTPGVCTVSPNASLLGTFDVTMVAGAGTCVLTASQAGDGNYNAAAIVQQNVAASQASQTISFDPLGNKTFGDADFTVSATGGASGNAVTFGAAGDCTLSGSTVHITGAGDCTVRASQSGIANYAAAHDVPRSFTIDKAASVVTVTCDAGPFVYKGSAFTPCSANVTGVGGLGQSLDVDYSNNVGAGTATASATFAEDANHLGDTDSKTFTIDKAGSTVAVTCPLANPVYTGSAIEPCSAKATGASLDQSLIVTYANNVDAGIASASANFAGDDNHTGNSDSKNFTIDKAGSTVAVTCPLANPVYTGSAIEPCTANAFGANLNQSLTVTYANNVDAGTASASANFAGDDNHTGNSDSKNFTIDRAPSTVTVTCTAGPFVYKGSAFTPCSANVTGVGGLSQSVVIDYSHNVDAGIASASANFAGDDNHTGNSDSKNFTIDKAGSTVAVTCPLANPVYTGSAIEPCTANAFGANLNQSLTVTYANNVDAGTASASANFAGDDNHTGNSDSKNFTIDRAPSTVTVTCTAGPFVYSGSAFTPCTANATGASLNQSLMVNYANNVDAGTASASASYAGDANHTGNTGSKNFTIDSAMPAVAVNWTSWTYDGTAHPASGSVTGVGGANLGSPSFTYYNGTSASGTLLAGAPEYVGTYTVLASFTGSPNYKPASTPKTVTATYRWDGFLQPINDTAHQGGFESFFKLGSAVPTKFQLKKADGTVVQASAAPTFSRSAAPVSCDTQVAPENLDADTGSSGSSFRWDATAQQYIYNWSTKGLKAGEYRVYSSLDDGTKQFVDICLQ